MKKLIITLTFLAALQLLTAQIRPVIISEVFYDTPLEEDRRKSPRNHNNGEFIELYNPTMEDINVSGWKLEDSNPTYQSGPSPTFYTIPSTTIIKAGEMLVIVYRCEEYNNFFQLSELFPSIFSNVTNNIIYQSTWIMSNSAECIKLRDNYNNIVDMMSYRYSSKTHGAENYWSLKAHNGRNAKQLKSIQRKNLHYTTSSVIFSQSDYYVDVPTPGKLPQGVSLAMTNNPSFENVNKALPVGTLAGEASVSPTGAANYNIPIEVPAGTNGFQPNISIAYNSQGGYGALGIGWDIGGLSSISRGLQNFYFDQTENGTIDATTIKFDDTDQLYIDGQRLILLEGVHFQAGAIYGSETENYARVKVFFNNVTVNIYFTLTTKEGNVTEYGKTSDALLRYGNKILAWRINRTKDIYGNEINYTYQDNGQYLQSINYENNKLEFTYIDNTEHQQKRCINGFWAVQNKLLNAVSVFANANIQQKFTFSYDLSEIYPRLNAVQPYNSDNEKSVNPTKIYWGAQSSIQDITLDKMPDGNLNNVDNGYMYSGDIDGDGIPDKITMWTGNEDNGEQGYIAVTLKNKTLPLVRFPAINKSKEKLKFIQLAIGDINRDGKDEIIRTAQDGVYVYSYNETDKALSTIMFNNLFFYNENYSLIPLLNNLNNDKYIDLIFIPYINRERSSYLAFISQSYFTQIFCGTAQGLSNCNAIGDFITISDIDGNFVPPIAGDFNADVKLDLLQLTYDKYSVNHLYNIDIVETDKLTWTEYIIEKENGNIKSRFQNAFPFDINNDGLTDILFKMNNHQWRLKRNNGGYDVKPTDIILPLPPAYAGTHGRDDLDYTILIDYNGDGYTDIVIADDSYTNNVIHTNWYFYKNTGGKFEFEDIRTTSSLSHIHPVVMDINNDGVPDIVFGDRRGGDNNNHYFKAFTMPAANKRNVVHAITNGLGQKEKFKYKYLSDYNQAPQNLNNPVRDIKAPMMVVENYQGADGTVTNYEFKNPKTHIEGRGFLGFETITATNSRTKQKTVSQYEINTEYYISNLKTQTVSVDGREISCTVNNNEIIKNANITQGVKGEKRFIAVINKQTITDKIRNIASVTDYSFNSYGVLTKQETHTADAASITEYLNFVQHNQGGLVSYLPQTVKATSKRTGKPDYAFTSTYNYNSNGDVQSSVEMQGTDAAIKTDYTYYPKGNLATVTVEPVNHDYPATTTTYGYDPKFRFVTSKITVLGTSYKTYDDFGRTLTETGIDGITTSYEYNALGQLIKKTLPTGESIIYKTEWGASCLYKRTMSSNVLSDRTTTYYDNIGRETYTETTGWKGALLKSFTEYDPITLKISKYTHPRYDGEAEVYTAYEYNDYLQRITKEKVYDGTRLLATTYNYQDAQGKVTVTAPDGTQTSSIKNELGEVYRRTDEGGTITYDYNALGKPVNIELNTGGNVSQTQIVYDYAGRQQQLHDPNAGIITYDYYAGGQIKKQINANGDITEFTYDNAGRTKTKTVKDYDSGILLSTTQTEYNYISSGNGTGQIQNITLKENGNTVHTQSFTYNNRHLTETVTDIYNGKTFTYSYTYDGLWRVFNTTSPSGLVTTNVYNSYGDITSVKAGNTVLWEGTAQNGKGQFTQYAVNNNSIATSKTYSPRGELTDIQTKKGAAFIQKNHYEYDTNTGSLTARNDLLNGRNERFEYDNLDRLTKAYLNNTLQYQMNYLQNGNISEKTDVGTYIYDSENKPHAMLGISNVGAGISEDKQFIKYTAFNKINRVAQGTDEFSITAEYKISYGLNEQRIKTEFYRNNNLKHTRYYIGSYELDIDSAGNAVSTDYVYTPTGLTAMVKNGEIFYVHLDRQGSLERITNLNGAIVSNYAYTPWGGRILIAGTNITDRGYTMHEHLTALGLINMNGRVYDPVLARFLSPDPYVQAPDFTQNFNRYSYCLNNPFKYTDPDGEWIHIVIGAVVGGIINVAIHWNQIENFGQGLAAFGIGAAGGALAAATGGAALGAFGTAAGAGGFIGGAVASGVGYTYGTMVTSMGNNIAFGDPMPTAGQFASGLGIAMLTGGTINGIVSAANGGNFFTGPKAPQPTVPQPTQPTQNTGTQQGQTQPQAQGQNPQPQSNNLPANVDYPPNNGAIGTPETKYLYQGEMVDRFGETTQYSRYLSPEGTPIPSRSLPPSTNLKLHDIYQVAKPFPVQSSTIAPYYGLPGMGTQYVTPLPIQLLVDKGILIRVIIPIP